MKLSSIMFTFKGFISNEVSRLMIWMLLSCIRCLLWRCWLLIKLRTVWRLLPKIHPELTRVWFPYNVSLCFYSSIWKKAKIRVVRYFSLSHQPFQKLKKKINWILMSVLNIHVTEEGSNCLCYHKTTKENDPNSYESCVQYMSLVLKCLEMWPQVYYPWHSCNSGSHVQYSQECIILFFFFFFLLFHNWSVQRSTQQL